MNTLKGGDYVAAISAGLPNISDNPNAAAIITGNEQQYGVAFKIIRNAMFWVTGNQQGYGTGDLSLDLSRGNQIYGNSNTVQPPALQLIPQIKY